MTAGGKTADELRALRAEARDKRNTEARMLAKMAGRNMEVYDARRLRERERRNRNRAKTREQDVA